MTETVRLWRVVTEPDGDWDCVDAELSINWHSLYASEAAARRAAIDAMIEAKQLVDDGEGRFKYFEAGVRYADFDAFALGDLIDTVEWHKVN